MEDNVKTRTQRFIQHKGITMKEFELACNLSSGYVTSMRKGYGSEKLNNVLTAFPELNREWLLYGEGEMLNTTADNRALSPPPNTNTEEAGAYTLLLPTAAQGGSLNDFVASVRASDCERIISPIRDVDFAIQISGDSMAPEYPNGSRVFVKRIDDKAFIEWGRTYVLDTCNGVVVKILTPSPMEGRVRCLSINPDPMYAPFDVRMDDIRAVYRILLEMSLK